MRKIFTLFCVLATSIACKAQVNPNPDFNHLMITGQVALITDMSQAMEYVWTVGDIDTETLKKGCFVQILGDYCIEDGNNGYFWLTNYHGQYGYNYNWADYEDESIPKGSLAKYGTEYMQTHGLEASNGKITKTYANRVVYFKYDPGNRVLYECNLRGYIGHYDWHDFYLQGYARTLEGTDPSTGYYDYEKVKDDPLSRYVYNINNPSEYNDSIPLLFSENPYQIDGPCVLMYKGQPWPLKLTAVESMDSIKAEECNVDPGTPWIWTYNTDPQGDTINLQAGVYIFFLSYYNQKDNTPLSLEVMRCDYGRSYIIGNDTLTQAGDYEVENVKDGEDETPTTPKDPTDPTYNPGTTTDSTDLYITSYYEYTERHVRYRYYTTRGLYGVRTHKQEYYTYEHHTSPTVINYPIEGLAEQLGYPGYIAIVYDGYNNNYTTNKGTLVDGGHELNIFVAEGDKGIPVVIYDRDTKTKKTIVYITDEQYQAIKDEVITPLDDSHAPGLIFDINGIKIDESDLQNGNIYIQDGKQFFYR
jgi:hypothetical protein